MQAGVLREMLILLNGDIYWLIMPALSMYQIKPIRLTISFVLNNLNPPVSQKECRASCKFAKERVGRYSFSFWI